HLSREKPWFTPNFEAMTGIVAARRPDLVVNTGDISLDGAARDDDLLFALDCHAALDAPLRAVPGNHDVGDNPWRAAVDPAVSDDGRERSEGGFGPGCWTVDADEWLLAGIDAQLFGSGLPAEERQWAFLASVAADAGSRSLALFLHKPLFNEDPAETEI